MPSPKPQSDSAKSTEQHTVGLEGSQLDGNPRRRPPENVVPPRARYHLMKPPTTTVNDSKQPKMGGLYANPSGSGSSMDIDCNPGDAQPISRPPLKKIPSNSSGDSGGIDGKASDADNGGESGESSGLTHESTAEDWFNTFNKDVGGNESFARYENDSPYYVPKTNDQPMFRRVRAIGFPSAQYEQMETAQLALPDGTSGGSGSESYRSVIDDLTIKNQKLKKKLRKLEGSRERDCGERLFEVRIHDLPENKKLELELLLRNFSASLDQGAAAELQSHRSQSHTVADSGYASVPRHGESPATVGTSSRGTGSGEGPRVWQQRHERNLETNKMKKVVAKLEQLFTGGDAGLGDRSQLLRQQNIANMAAVDDWNTLEQMGGEHELMGSREAPIMDEQTNIDQRRAALNKTPSSDESGVEPLKQRPTRPMDLDPARKQVAEDNIEYLMNLTESGQRNPGIPDGWVYLNLIMNLAQLHTISVTPPFVRKAIEKVSSKLELSQDGKMVRWKAGRSGDTQSGTQSADSGAMASMEGSGSGSADSSKRVSPPSKSTSDGYQAQDEMGPSPSSTTEESKFHYKPIFYKDQAMTEDSSSGDASTDPEFSPNPGNGSAEGYGSPIKNSGLMIYYRNGNFCTDLSCTAPGGNGSSDDSAVRYERITSVPLGAKTSKVHHQLNSTRESPLYQAMRAAASGSLAVDEDSEVDLGGSETELIEFHPEFTSHHPSPHRPPIEFEASGVGGVVPADNFAINCQTKYYILPETQGRLPVSRSKHHRRHQKKILHRISKASIHAFQDENNMSDNSSVTDNKEPMKEEPTSSASLGGSRRRLVLPRHELVSADTLKLPPSTLPPASYIFGTPSEDSSSDDAAAATALDARRADYFSPTLAPRPQLDCLRTSSDEHIHLHLRSRSAATFPPSNGSGSAQFSDFSEQIDEFEEDDEEDEEEEEETFDQQTFMDSAVDTAASRGRESQQRPSLKRQRGSLYRESSPSQNRKSQKGQKSQKVGDLGF